MIAGNKAYCANVGDSRALLVGYDETKKEVINTPMSKDHKPDDELEAERVLASGGRIDTFKDSNGGPFGP
jgi:serine/threonine protein phosphatase PrpC